MTRTYQLDFKDRADLERVLDDDVLDASYHFFTTAIEAGLDQKVEKGVHPEACDNYGRTALFYLTWRGRNCDPEAIAYLIDRGADPFEEDGNGDSCATFIAEWSQEQQDELASFVKTDEGRAVLTRLLAR